MPEQLNQFGSQPEYEGQSLNPSMTTEQTGIDHESARFSQSEQYARQNIRESMTPEQAGDIMRTRIQIRHA